MSELETVDPTAAEPRTYGSESLFMEKLDPPKEQAPAPFDSSPAGLEEAANTRLNGAERNVVDVVQWHDNEGNVHAGDKVASAEHSADQLKAFREQKALAEQQALDAELVAAIDENRSQAATEKMAEELTAAPVTNDGTGVRAPVVEQPQPEFPQEPSLSPELAQAFQDPEFVQKAMKHPGFQAEVTRLVQGVETVRQQHAQAVIETGRIAAASLAVNFPELQNLRNDDEVRGAVNAMRQMNPQRYEALSRHYNAVANVIGQAQQVQQQQVAEQNFKQQLAWNEFAKTEDAKVEKFLAGETPTQRAVIVQEVMSMLREEGFSDEWIGQLWNTDPAFRRSISQKTLIRAAKHRISERGIRSAKSNPIPKVARPGVSEPRADYSELTSMQNRFNAAPTKELAAALIQARRSAGR